MTLITEYSVTGTKSGHEICISNESSVCPDCGKPLKYRDKKIRIYKTYNGKKHHMLIRRLKCSTNGGCGRLHNELPAFLSPYKHYVSEIIENVIDGVSTPYDPTSEDYPCEKTMHRWIVWFLLNYILLEMTARYLQLRRSGDLVLSLNGGPSSLSALRQKGAGWLSFLMRYIYNCGGRLVACKG